MTVLSPSEAPAGMESGDRTRRAHPRKSARSLLPGSRIAYVYILPFFLVFAAFSIYPWIATAWPAFEVSQMSFASLAMRSLLAPVIWATVSRS